jgi:hypothetical protein
MLVLKCYLKTLSLRFYMNASRLQQFSSVLTEQDGLQLYIRPCCSRYRPLRALMKSADSHLILLASSKLFAQYRFSESQVLPDLSSHLIAVQLFDVHPVLNVDLLCGANRSRRLYAHVVLLIRPVMRASTAQIVRAILFASATITTLRGRRLMICSAHGPGSFARVSTLRAP